MQHGLKLRNYKITKLQNRQRGYMMIMLMLAFAMITIALLAVLPAIKQQIQRDREDELRHRGTAYMRAIQHFYRKFGRYPMRVEELENTNNLRFLRKRYTDPVNRDPATGKERDFKLLHQTDIPLNSGLALGQMPGLGGLPGQGSPGGAQGQLNAGNAGAVLGALQQAAVAGAQPAVAMGDSGNPDSGNSPDTEGNANSPGSSPSGSSSNSSSGFNGPTFGGGPILGVASLSKEKPIRVFNGKSHYKDWLFVYVPQADRGGLLVGPLQLGFAPGNFGGAAPGMSGGVPGQGAAPNSGQPQVFSSQPQPNPAPSSPEQ